MAMRPRGLRALHARVLDGPHGGRRLRSHGPLILAVLCPVLALGAILLLASRAAPATGQGARCDFDGECPPALSCHKGRCAP